MTVQEQQSNTHTINPVTRAAVLFLFVVFITVTVVAALFFMLDWANRRALADTEAVVIHKKFATTKRPGQFHHMLILARDRNVWTVRVSPEFYYSVRPHNPDWPGDRVLLTRSAGAITGFTYDYTLTAEDKQLPLIKAD